MQPEKGHVIGAFGYTSTAQLLFQKGTQHSGLASEPRSICRLGGTGWVGGVKERQTLVESTRARVYDVPRL